MKSSHPGPVARSVAGVRWALSRARAAMIFTVPYKWRGRVAASLPARLVPPAMRPGHVHHLYDDGDPFGFDVNPVEQLKFRRTLEVCGGGPLGRVLELGCAVGSFTQLLAPRAADVLAVDGSPAAVEHVARRLRDHPNVRTEAMTIPAEFPEGPFDLVVASDILYYLPAEDVRRSLERIEAAIAEGGALVAAHYVPRMGTVLDGDETHDILAAHSRLRHVLSERTEFGPGRTYRVDRYEKD